MFSLFGRWRIALGVVAIGVLLAPEIVIVCAISVIGLPIALMLILTPPLFALSLGAWIFGKAFQGSGLRWIGWPIAVGMAALAAAVINTGLDREVKELIAGDRDALRPSQRVGSLVILSAGQRAWSRGQTQCDDFCQTALLAGAADRVVVGWIASAAEAPDETAPGASFRLERRDDCPPVSLVERRNARPNSGGPAPAELLRLKIAQGECLIEEEAPVGVGDAVIVYGVAHKGVSPAAAGLNPFADTVNADRISYYEKQGQAFVETYRLTDVIANKHLPLLLPSVIPDYGLDMTQGFWRDTEYVNRPSRYEQNDFWTFAADKLGLNLSLPESIDAAAVVDEALEAGAAVDATVAVVAEDFFKRAAESRDLSRADAERALAVLQDNRWDVPRYTGRIVRNALQTHPDLAAPLAAALFRRLATTDAAQKENHPSYLGYTLSYAADGIMELPDDAIAPYRDALEDLARDPAKRVRAYRLLSKLAIFGADSVPTFLYLIDDAAAQGEIQRGERVLSGDDWQHPYLGAMYGLCALGLAGASAVPDLLSRLETRAMPRYERYWKLTIHTLVSLGADPEELWPRLQSDDPNLTRERFDSEARRAAKKLDCYY